MSGPQMDRLEEYGRSLAARVPVDERSGFRAELRARLLAQVGPAVAARRRHHGLGLAWLRPLAAVLGALALLVGSGGLVAAGSLPGDPGFALKRAAEEAVLALAFDDAARTERLVAQSEARLAELRRAPAGRVDAAAREHARALERLGADLERLRRSRLTSREEAALRLAEASVGWQREVLEALRATAPAEAQDALRRASDAAERIGAPMDRPIERDAPPVRPTPGLTPPPTRPGVAPPESPAPRSPAEGTRGPVQPRTPAPLATAAPPAATPTPAQPVPPTPAQPAPATPPPTVQPPPTVGPTGAPTAPRAPTPAPGGRP